ncbi:MAG TPA: DUF1801 domain-containing protein [Thermoplasmata archaeon]|nr:DUF1801 domain-containing protein [Thermoplasmata archaeon]
MGRAKEVDTYIEESPKSVQPRLREIRAAVRRAAPDAVESMSYGMPFYSFKGESGFKARLCYFGLLKKKMVFYTRPVFLRAYRDEVEAYLSTKSALHFPLDKPIPAQLIEKLVRNGTAMHKAGSDD